MRNNSAVRRLLMLILSLYFILAVINGITNPLFEAPDEHHHYFAAVQIARVGGLISSRDANVDLAAQEASQPPLYYVIAALITSPLQTGSAEELLWVNPRVRLGDASSPANINRFVHTGAERWPWQEPVWAAHLMRLLSTLLGLGTLLFVYGSARLIWKDKPERALLSTAAVAFLPQYVFLHSSISNDPLVILFSSAAIYLLITIWFGGLDRRLLLLLGVTVGLAILSKMAGLLLLVYCLGFVFVIAVRDRDTKPLWRELGGTGFVVLLPALLISGWLLVRNWLLYGDPTATSEFIRFAGGSRDFSVTQVLGESSSLWRSIFAVFGWFNVVPPSWTYWIWNGIALCAGLAAAWGLVRFLRRSGPAEISLRDRSPLVLALLLSGWLLLVYAGLFRFMLSTPAAQGRLLFPALIPMALGLAYGIAQYRQRWLLWLVPALLLFTTIYALFYVIPSAYALPEVITEGEIPPTAVTINSELLNHLELLAYEIEQDQVRPGDWIWLTLYWRSTGPLPRTTQALLEAYGRDLALAGKTQGYHGRGLYPASLWPVGKVIVDRTPIQLYPETAVPVEVRFFQKLRNNEQAAAVGTVKAVPPSWPAPSDAIVASFDGLELVEAALSRHEARAGEQVEVRLRWQVTEAPGRDLTTFVHLGNSSRQPLAQADSPPVGGDYRTGLWEKGEVINDTYILDIPTDLAEGTYPLHIGLYDPPTGLRVPLSVQGNRVANDAFQVGQLSIVN